MAEENSGFFFADGLPAGYAHVQLLAGKNGVCDADSTI